MGAYIQSFLFIMFGAILNEAGVRITTVYFWLLVSIILGILLTIDIVIPGDDPEDENEDDKNPKGK